MQGRPTHTNYPPSRGTTRGGGRGRGRGRGRGQSPSFRGNNTRNYSTVPSYSSLHPGTPVSIILKQDQQSGHQVRGIVADLLTRGDHPRGVKVRLRDGRVGRVQVIVSESEGRSGEAVVGGPGAGLGRDGEVGGGGTAGAGAGAGGRGGRMICGRVERDIREDDEYLFDDGRGTRGCADTGLFAALEEADRKYEQSVGNVGRGEGGDTAVCPVCGGFEGDEVAVARHVEGHFE